MLEISFDAADGWGLVTTEFWVGDDVAGVPSDEDGGLDVERFPCCWCNSTGEKIHSTHVDFKWSCLCEEETGFSLAFVAQLAYGKLSKKGKVMEDSECVSFVIEHQCELGVADIGWFDVQFACGCGSPPKEKSSPAMSSGGNLPTKCNGSLVDSMPVALEAGDGDSVFSLDRKALPMVFATPADAESLMIGFLFHQIGEWERSDNLLMTLNGCVADLGALEDCDHRNDPRNEQSGSASDSAIAWSRHKLLDSDDYDDQTHEVKLQLAGSFFSSGELEIAFETRFRHEEGREHGAISNLNVTAIGTWCGAGFVAPTAAPTTANRISSDASIQPELKTLAAACIASILVEFDDFESEGSEDKWHGGTTSYNANFSHFLGRIGRGSECMWTQFDVPAVADGGVVEKVTIAFACYQLDEWSSADAFKVVLGSNTEIKIGESTSEPAENFVSGEETDGVSWWRETFSQGSNLGFGPENDKKHLVEITIPSTALKDAPLVIGFKVDSERSVSHQSAGVDDLNVTAHCDCSPEEDRRAAPSLHLTQCEAHVASLWGDAHLMTFDGLAYSCVGSQGEFTLLKSMTSNFEMQARFVGVPTEKHVSVAKAIVVNPGDAGLPKIQLDIADNSTVSMCRADVHVNDELRNPGDFSGDGPVSIQHGEETDNTGEFATSHPTVGVNAIVLAKRSEIFGCVLSAQACLPDDCASSNGKWVGLLGSPNKNSQDDWMTTNGTSLYVPRKEMTYSKAYNYCGSQWCIRSEENSLFTCNDRDSETFSSFCHCDLPCNSEIEDSLRSAKPSSKSLCKNDVTCLSEVFAGGTEDATSILTVQDTLNISTIVCENAWVVYKANNSQQSKCLEGSNRTAWSNGPFPKNISANQPIVMDIMKAGPSSGCSDMEASAIKVGESKVCYENDKFVVTIHVDDGHFLLETHLHVGPKRLPQHMRREIVDPEGFPHKNENIEAVTDTFMIRNLVDRIYVSAHAMVCGSPLASAGVQNDESDSGRRLQGAISPAASAGKTSCTHEVPLAQETYDSDSRVVGWKNGLLSLDDRYGHFLGRLGLENSFVSKTFRVPDNAESIQLEWSIYTLGKVPWNMRKDEFHVKVGISDVTVLGGEEGYNKGYNKDHYSLDDGIEFGVETDDHDQNHHHVKMEISNRDYYPTGELALSFHVVMTESISKKSAGVDNLVILAVLVDDKCGNGGNSSDDDEQKDEKKGGAKALPEDETKTKTKTSTVSTTDTGTTSSSQSFQQAQRKYQSNRQHGGGVTKNAAEPAMDGSSSVPLHDGVCFAEDFPCGNQPGMVYICHYSISKGYSTYCLKEEETDIVRSYKDDYCGPCVGGYGGSYKVRNPKAQN